MHRKKLKLAMALRGAQKHYRLVDIRRRHFNEPARLCGLGRDMDAIIDDVVERTPHVIDTVAAKLPRGFPAQVFDTITKGLRRAADELRALDGLKSHAYGASFITSQCCDVSGGSEPLNEQERRMLEEARASLARGEPTYSSAEIKAAIEEMRRRQEGA